MELEKDDWHSFWAKKDGTAKERLEAMVDLRRYIDGLRESAQCFRRSDIEDRHWREFREPMLIMAGSWALPDIFTASQDTTRWMNPGYRHAYKCPAVYATCECGATITHSYQTDFAPLDDEHEHTDDCYKADRLRARADLLDNRKQFLLRGMKLGRSLNSMAPAVGVKRTGIGSVAKSLNIDSEKMRDIYREKSAYTYVYLQEERNVESSLIAEAYNVNHSTLSDWVNKYTEYGWSTDLQRWLTGI
jgi:hypothetical protein